MSAALLRTARAVLWYIRQVTGEAKWDEYMDRCRAQGIDPMTRREFERHRSDHRESNAQSRCC
jgi:uncharacterized short protein YbdD (DUF466 family)